MVTDEIHPAGGRSQPGGGTAESLFERLFSGVREGL
jgi:hypothetical protein